jgi:hypothetical protein
MIKITRLVALLVIVTVFLSIGVPALANPQDGKIECVVQPVVGGPNNAHLHNTNATVSIPVNNPAIRWNPADIIPGKVFVPAGGGPG